MKYLLDTDTVSYALRGEGEVAGRIIAHKPSEVCISAITLAELRYGADRRGSRKLHALIDTFAAAVEVVGFGEDAALAFGRIGGHRDGPSVRKRHGSRRRQPCAARDSDFLPRRRGFAEGQGGIL